MNSEVLIWLSYVRDRTKNSTRRVPFSQNSATMQLPVEEFGIHRVPGIANDEIVSWPESLLNDGCHNQHTDVTSKMRDIWSSHKELYEKAYESKRLEDIRINSKAAYVTKRQQRISEDPTCRPAIQTRLWTYDDWIKELRSQHICESQTFKIVPPSRGKAESDAEVTLHKDGEDEDGNAVVRAWSKNYKPSKLNWTSNEDLQSATSVYAAHAAMVKRMRTRNDQALRERDALRHKRTYDDMSVEKRKKRNAQCEAAKRRC